MVRRDRRTRGQALLEFALVLPVFLIMLMAVVDVGRAIWAQNSVAAAAREGARFAIVHGGSDNTLCPVGPKNPDRTKDWPSASASCPYPSPSKQSIKDAVAAAAAAAGTNHTVTVCYGAGCSGDTDLTSNKRGEPITVAVTSRVNLISSALLGQSGFGISSVTTMVVNH
jgi:Flp pilus assembly protein TadG